MVETLPTKPWQNPKFQNRLYRLGGYFGLTDYDPSSSIRSPRATRELGGRLTYPFSSYIIDRALINLSVKMQPNLPKYDTVLSDDISSHLVSTVFWRLINQVRDVVGRTPAQIFYLAAGQNSKAYPAIAEFLSSRSSDLGNVLLCTEYTENGTVLNRLSMMLDNINANYDLAILIDGGHGRFKHPRGHKYDTAYTGDIWVSKTRPPTDFMNDPKTNGVYRNPNQTDPFPREYINTPQVTARTASDMDIFIEAPRVKNPRVSREGGLKG